MRLDVAWAPIALALSILAAAPAAGHGRLVGTVPAADAVLAQAPPEIVLIFDEAVITDLSGISIREENGEEWTVPAAAASATDATRVVVPLPEPLDPGRFTVRWRVVSRDMHKVEGEFDFVVAPP